MNGKIKLLDAGILQMFYKKQNEFCKPFDHKEQKMRQKCTTVRNFYSEKLCNLNEEPFSSKSSEKRQKYT